MQIVECRFYRPREGAANARFGDETWCKVDLEDILEQQSSRPVEG
jgi:hypothetical protein